MSEVNMWAIEDGCYAEGYQVICGVREDFSEAELVRAYCEANSDK